MTSKATVTRTRSGNLRGSVDPQALSRELDSLKSDVSGIKRVLAPAFTAPKESTTVAEPSPPRSVTTSNGTTNWSVYPDHDPEYLAGQITLEQARARHQRPDEGCGCPNCTHQRKQAARIVSPETEPQARCPFCRGSGYTGRPEGMGWQPCTACHAEEFERLAREAYQGNEFSAVSEALLNARQRIIDCEECHGSGKTWQPLPPTPCSPCRGTGKDDHLVTPRGTLWKRAGGDYAKDTSGTSGGGSPPEQRTMWSARDDGLPAPELPASTGIPAEPAGIPATTGTGADFARARVHAAQITRPRGG